MLGWIAVPTTAISLWLAYRETRPPSERYDDDIIEAKRLVGSIQRGAIASYEREAIGSDPAGGRPPVPTLCASATPVPAKLPVRGEAHAPSSTSGEDFETGDATTGWKCLRFTVNEEIRFQYEYRQGGNYKGPARAGPDPGPDGFEVSAEADLDGDGKKTTLITVVGLMHRSRKAVMRGEETFIANE